MLIKSVLKFLRSLCKTGPDQFRVPEKEIMPLFMALAGMAAMYIEWAVRNLFNRYDCMAEKFAMLIAVSCRCVRRISSTPKVILITKKKKHNDLNRYLFRLMRAKLEFRSLYCHCHCYCYCARRSNMKICCSVQLLHHMKLYTSSYELNFLDFDWDFPLALWSIATVAAKWQQNHFVFWQNEHGKKRIISAKRPRRKINNKQMCAAYAWMRATILQQYTAIIVYFWVFSPKVEKARKTHNEPRFFLFIQNPTHPFILLRTQ